MKKLFLIIGCCLALCGINQVSAQISITPEDLLLPTNPLLEQEFKGQHGNYSFIRQEGYHNEVYAEQRLLASNELNLLKVFQRGQDNYALLVQIGAENQLALLQTGRDNYYKLINESDGNRIGVIQAGSNNKIIQELIDSNDLTIQLIQQGNNNEIIQILEGVSSKELRVKQIGDNMQLVIEQRAY